jgi:hypothetical protein
MSKTILRHTLMNKYFWHFCWLPYLYTFSLCENASFIIVSAETEYISTRSWYRNINFYFFINVWRKIVFDICFTGFGSALTTILPILFQYCYKYCNNKITELRTILQREIQNSQVYKQTKSVNRKTVKTVMTLTL